MIIDHNSKNQLKFYTALFYIRKTTTSTIKQNIILARKWRNNQMLVIPKSLFLSSITTYKLWSHLNTDTNYIYIEILVQ